MWPYQSVSREEFEERKDFIDKILKELGCKIITPKLPYKQKTTTYSLNTEETWYSNRPLYQYQNHYYRIDEVLFHQKPFLVIECAQTIEEVQKNIMEDADPFPYELPDTEIIKEIKYSLGIEPYPTP